jgi:hypothetical protein
MHKSFLFVTLWISNLSILLSQDLPSQWYVDKNLHKVSFSPPSTKIYDESSVEEIRLYFKETNYWNLLSSNYSTKKDLMCKMVYKGTMFDSVGVRFKGQTSYFMNPSQKKSFNISLDAFVEGQDINGYNTINLNNSFEDPSMMREVLYYHLIRQHTPAAKANFVNLYLNDQLWGVYQNVQQLNKDFIKEWYVENDGINIRADKSTSGGGMGPGWGDGTAAFNYLGQDTALYKKYYTLKSGKNGVNPWIELRDATQVINQSNDLLNDAPKVLDVDKVLWHLACEIIFADDDSYVYKGKMDYYLYQDEVTKRWATYDYDANSTFGRNRSNWSPFYNAEKVNYPLLNKLLAVPEFRQRYLAHMRTIVKTSLDQNSFDALVKKYDELINAHVNADPKKLSSYSSYTSELNNLKKFISDRVNYLMTNPEFTETNPLVQNGTFSVNGSSFALPKQGQKSTLSVITLHPAGIQKVNAYITNTVNGIFTVIPMNDSGINGDAIGGDGIWSIEIDNNVAGTYVYFYFEVVANNNAKTVSYYPAGAEHEMMFYYVEPNTVQGTTVVINEFMASNTGIITDDNGETEDWIELYNTTDAPIILEGYHITDNEENLEKYTFPAGVQIPPKGYLIIWADEDGMQGPTHANFKLSASGEQIILLNPQREELDRVVFGSQETNKSSARRPNGTGPFVIGNHTFNAFNDGSATSNDFISLVKVFPNPAHDMVFFQSEGDVNVDVEVYNLFGQMIDKANTKSMDISQWNRGTYLLKINKTQVTKLVVF